MTSRLGVRRWAFISGLGAIVAVACSTKERDLGELLSSGAPGAGNSGGEGATGAGAQAGSSAQAGSPSGGGGAGSGGQAGQGQSGGQAGLGGQAGSSGQAAAGGEAPSGGQGGLAGAAGIAGAAGSAGTETGGVSTGGVSNGGTSTGGVSTGGVTTGGTSTGGVTTGGTSTGGVGGGTGGSGGAAGASGAGGAGGSGGSATGGTGGITSCVEPTVDCAGACVDLGTDDANCGTCGYACTAGRSCTSGGCYCDGGQQSCSDVCVDTSTDRNNCGFCGTVCDADKDCVGGVCACLGSELNCSNVCVDPLTDRTNCGGCGTVCDPDRSCVSGTCTCTSPLLGCDGVCINPFADIANCGSCGRKCVSGQVCASGTCACTTGLTQCTVGGADACVDTQTDGANCGACGNVCGANQSCVGGVCTCNGGLLKCGGVCVDAQTSSSNCGACGNVCSGAFSYCSSGACASSCVGTVCGTSCVNVQSDVQNCGTCGNVCNLQHSTQQCTAGTCTLGPCQAGWYNLDGIAATGCEYSCPNSPLVTELCSDAVRSNDGTDNDCNGTIDCAFVESTFPELDKAAAGQDVFIKVRPPFATTFTLECRTAKPSSAMPAWAPCAVDPTDPRKVLPWTTAQSADPANNGRWITEVRIKYANGRASAPTPAFRYYVHNSLHGLTRCTPKTTDAWYFDAAEDLLLNTTTPPPTFTSTTPRLANPFINVTFTPPRVSALNWGLSGTATNVEMLSLRRRFVLNPTGQLLLVTRVYPARRGWNASWACEAGLNRKHDYFDGISYDKTRDYWNHCDAWVLNQHGAGVCLKVDGTTVKVVNPTSTYLAARIKWLATDLLNPQYVNWPNADNLMWRKIGLTFRDELFSPKCYSAPSCVTSTNGYLYLPDRALFGLP